MKTKYLFLIIIIYSYQSVKGQSLGQDTENFSTIVFPSTNISLNLSESIATFSFYRDSRLENKKPNDLTNIRSVFFDSKFDTPKKIELELKNRFKTYNKTLNKNSKYLSWGLDFTGESSNGVAPIFSSDKIASSASVSGLIGYRWTRNKYDDKYLTEYAEAGYGINKAFKIKSKVEELLKNKIINSANKASLLEFLNINNVPDKVLNVEYVIKQIPKIKLLTPNSLDSEINHLASLLTTVNKISTELKKKTADESSIFLAIKNLKVLINTKKFEKLNGTFKFDKENIFETQWEGIKLKLKNTYLFKKELKKNKTVSYDGAKGIIELTNLFNKYLIGLKELEKTKLNSTSELLDKILYSKKYLIYLRGGFTGSEFKYDLENNGTTTETRFEDRSFNGFNVELGTTIQARDFNFFGFSLGYSYRHNLDQLKNQTSALQVKDPNILNGNLVNVTEVKAMKGMYDRFNRLDLNFDYVRLFKLKENQNSEDLSYLYLSLNPYLRHRVYENAEILNNNTILGLGIYAYNSKDNKLMGGLYVQTPDFFGVHKNDKGIFDEGVNFGLIVKYNFQGLKAK